jgi:hypothetical protein
MAINPSDIGNIGLSGGNPVEAMAQGYKLADLVDQRQMNKMKMQAYQQEAQDAQTLKSMAGKYDLSTEEGRTSYAAAAAKVDPAKGMEALKAFTELDTQQNKLQESNYAVMGKKLEMEAQSVAPLWQQASQMQAQGRSPQEIDAALLPSVTQTLKSLSQQTLPNGKPVLSQEEIAGFSQKLQNGNIKGALDGIMMNHEKGAEWLKMQQPKFGTTKTMTGKEGPGVYERNERTGEWTKVGGMAPTAAAQNQVAGVTPGAIPAGGIDPGLVKSIGTYGRPPLSVRERNTPAGQAVMAEVRKQYPEYKEYQYKVIGDAVNKFSTGKQGDTLRSIGTSMRHISTLEETVDALKNGDVAMLNRLGNVLQNELGLSSAPNDFDTIKGLVADEINKAVVGGAGTGGERQELQQKIKSSLKPETLASALKYLKELMGGQLLGLEYQYKSATGLKDFEDRFLGEQPETVDLLLSEKERTKGSGKGAAPAGGAPKQITSDAEFNALPSGAVFLDPNGKQRRKP